MRAFDKRSSAEIEAYSNLREVSWMLPPALKRPSGRPKKKARIKSGLEMSMAKKARKMHCSICGGLHRRNKCPNAVTRV